MINPKDAWAVRPYPHDKYRLSEFLSNHMVAIGWPSIGDLTGCPREDICKKLEAHYGGESRSIGQTTGIIDRFVNQIKIGDAIVVPDGDKIYFGVVTDKYTFKENLVTDEEGYPHWIKVDYCFDGKPIPRIQLSEVLFGSLKGRQTVFGLPSDDVMQVINNPSNYEAEAVDTVDLKAKAEYVDKLSNGKVPGINSSSFEEAVRKVLSFYFPGLLRLPTRNAPVGADTDLKASLPGGVVIRVQVKCYRDDWGKLSEEAVRQLRKSMKPGDQGIVVTTSKVEESARKLADSDAEKPIGIIDGWKFAELVFDNLDMLDDKDLWTLGLRRQLGVR